MGLFSMDTGATHGDAVKQKKEAEEFMIACRKNKEIKDRILASSFTSDDAVALGNEIDSFDPLLKDLYERLDNFGNVGMYASRETVGLNEQVKQSVKY